MDGWLIDRLSAAIEQIDGALTLAALRGIEGAGTRAYFAIFRGGLQHSLGFERRARRPPTDPVNSLLSLGYTLLTQNLMAAAEIVHPFYNRRLSYQKCFEVQARLLIKVMEGELEEYPPLRVR